MRQSDMQSASAHPNLLITHAQPNSGAWQHTLNIWISRVCVPPWKQSWWGGKEFWVFTGKKKKSQKKTLARFLLSIPSCSLGNVLYYEKGKKRKKRFLPSSFLAGFFHGAAIASAVWGWVSVLRFWNFARWTCHCECEQNHLSITATYTPPSESTRQRWVFLIVVLT